MSFTIADYARRQAQALRPFLSPEAQLRCDSIGFARSFEHIEKELERVEYAPLMSEILIPSGAYGASPGHKTVTYRIISQSGAADYVKGKSNDIPRADVHATEFEVKIEALGVEYAWDVMELDSVAVDPTVKLDAERKKAAIDAVRLKHDEAAAIGSTKLGRTGFINSPLVPVLTASGVFSGLTTDVMIAQIRRVLDAPRVATDNIHIADTLAVDDGTWELLNAPRANTDTTTRKWLMENLKIKNIEVWSRLNLANAAGNGPRIIAYKKDPGVVRYYNVQLMKELAPQSRDYEVVVPCYGYTGFTNIRRPKAMAYMDGV
jgi:hypothetical protein